MITPFTESIQTAFFHFRISCDFLYIYLYIIGKFAVFHSDIECAYYGLKASR